MQTPPPDPPPEDERTVTLASAGYQQREGQRPRFTQHTYLDVVVVHDHVGKPGWGQRWKCAVTGAVRVWGFCGNRHDSDDAEDDGDESSDGESSAETTTTSKEN